MRNTFDPQILAQAAGAQALALEPAASVWISANAGTGKTEVLTRRMLALLLSDPTLEPRQILALTFTKAGAAEMAARLPARLATWAMLDEADIMTEVKELGVTVPDGVDIPARVKALAAMVRKAPPLVATIHGLAQQVLSRFTVEAGLPIDFAVLEEGAQQRLLREIQHQLLVTVDGPLAEYLGVLLDQLGEHGWDDLTKLVVYNWRRLQELVDGDGLAGVLTRLERELGLQGRDDAGRPLVPTTEEWAVLQRVADTLPEHAARTVLESPEALREDAWRSLLLKSNDGARALTGNGGIFRKADLAEISDADTEILLAAAARVAEHVRLRRVYRGFEVTRAALLWAAAVRGAYVQRKQQEGLVDYTDLLDGLERVMKASEAGLSEWVWYGLDRRFRHLVVDEAQDNNPQQDAIVQGLAKSILSGDVGEGAARTVLAVGDIKQSIFRFQGAVPELFVRLREVLRTWAPTVREVDLVHSFRSGKEILALVDRVFEAGDTGTVVLGEDARDWPAHKAVAAARPSRVELWPTVVPDKTETVEPWALPELRAAANGHGADILCLQQVGTWLQTHVGRTMMPSTGKPLTYDDVMLVVQRNKYAAMAAGVLRSMGLPVASGGGVQPLVVDDAVACLRLVFNPDDNLALAQVLKAVRRWTDAQLLDLAARSRDVPWCTNLMGDDAAWLTALCEKAWDSPLGLTQHVVKLVGGNEHVFEGLLGWAEQCADLRELIDRLELDDLPVSGTGHGVKILTVHGSKGLQAPLVILPDTMAALADMRRDTLLWGEKVVLFKQSRDLTELEKTLTEDEEARRKADSLRGLYVATTRAMDWLVVTGFGEVKDSADTWWTRVRAGFEGEANEDGLWVQGETFEQTEVANVSVEKNKPLPAWMTHTVTRNMTGEEQSAAQMRGDLVHACLQGLNIPVPDEVRHEAARVREALPWLWGKGFRSEVAVAINGHVGRIDRLVEQDGALWVIDFKTGEVPATVPETYRAQVQAYATALRAAYPERKIRAAIVWTAEPRLDEVPVEC